MFSSGEYGGKNNNSKPNFFHLDIWDLKSLLVCIEALSSITTVVFVILLANSLKKSITTWVSTLVVVILDTRLLFFVFRNPRTFILLANLLDGISTGLDMGDQ